MDTANDEAKQEPKQTMKRKSSKKTKSKRSKDVNQPIKDHAYYQNIITSLNRTLATLRNKTKAFNEQNYKLISEKVTIEEDRLEIAEHLKRCQKKCFQETLLSEKQIYELTKERDEYNETTEKRLKDLQRKYDETHQNLLNEAKLLSTTLLTLEDFGGQRQQAFGRFGVAKKTMHQYDQQIKDMIYNEEQKAVVTKDAIKKEVDLKIHLIAKEFKRANEVRLANTTRNIICENIALHKTLDQCQTTYMNLVAKQSKQAERAFTLLESHAGVEQMIHHLQRNVSHQHQIIEGLRKRAKLLNVLYVEAKRYRQLYENSGHRSFAERFEATQEFLARNEDTKYELGKEVNVIKHHIMAQEAELLEKRNALEALRSSVDSVTQPIGPQRSSEVQTMAERQHLMMEIIEVLSSGFDENQRQHEMLSNKGNSKDTQGNDESCDCDEVGNTTIYRPGSCGLMSVTCPKPFFHASKIVEAPGECRSLNIESKPGQYKEDFGSIVCFSESTTSDVANTFPLTCGCNLTCRCDYCWTTMFRDNTANYNSNNNDDYKSISGLSEIRQLRDEITTEMILLKSCGDKC